MSPISISNDRLFNLCSCTKRTFLLKIIQKTLSYAINLDHIYVETAVQKNTKHNNQGPPPKKYEKLSYVGFIEDC